MYKRIIYFLTILVLFSCTVEEPQSVGIYMFIDVTDGIIDIETNIENDLNQLENFTKVSESNGGENGIELRIFEINNLSESNSRSFYLNKSIPGLLGKNPLDRIDEIKKFNHSVKEYLKSIQTSDKKSLSNSKIYQNLCREFSSMGFEHDKNLIIVHSDMLENSELFSFYRDKNRITNWEKDISLAADYLEGKDCSLPSLINVQMHIISKRNEVKDKLINSAHSFWKKLFTYKGAKVFFDTELNLKSSL